MKRLLLPLAAGAALFGVTALIPSQAGAQTLGAAAAINLDAEAAFNLIEVGRRDRSRRHSSRHRHWRWRHFARPYFYAPYAYYPRRCGYAWSHRYDRYVYRCW